MVSKHLFVFAMAIISTAYASFDEGGSCFAAPKGKLIKFILTRI